MNTFEIALLLAFLAVMLLIAAAASVRQRLEAFDQYLDESSAGLREIGEKLDVLDREVLVCHEMIEIGLAQYARDQLKYRHAKELTLAAIRTWEPGKIVRLIEADWTPKSERPLISSYEFRFGGIEEEPNDTLGHKIHGEWRFAPGEPWKDHFIRASEQTATARILA